MPDPNSNPSVLDAPSPSPADYQAASAAPGSQASQVSDVVNSGAQNQPTNPTVVPDSGGKAHSVWRQVLVGALQGLATGGVVGAARQAVETGATGLTPAQRMGRDDAQQQQSVQSNIRFRDAEAAKATAEAALYAHTVAHLPEEDQQRIEAANLTTAKLLENEGWTSSLAVDHDSNDSGVAALNQLAASHGQVPSAVTLRVPGATLVYAPPAAGSVNGNVEAINALMRRGGLPELSADTIRTMSPQQQYALLQKGIVANQVEVSADKLPSAIARDQGIIKWYGIHRSWDKDAIGAVQDRLDAEQNALSSHTQIKQQNEVYAQQVKDQSAQAAQKNQDFIDRNYIKPATDSEQSFRMFNAAYNDPQRATSGAPSMVALSTHLATTFGNVKGARVTKDMIHEHLGARNVSDDALAAVQKLTSGDVLAPSQWDAFRTLITDSRNTRWQLATQQALARGMRVDDLVPRLPSDIVRTGKTKDGRRVISVAGSSPMVERNSQ